MLIKLQKKTIFEFNVFSLHVLFHNHFYRDALSKSAGGYLISPTQQYTFYFIIIKQNVWKDAHG